MLSLVAFLTILLILVLILTKKLSPLASLIIVPIIATVVIGQGAKLGTYVVDGIKSIAPTGVMFIFAILFFGVLTDAGTFDPIISKILKTVGKDPVKVAIGTAILAMLVHLDGSGAVTFVITVPALLPLYKQLNMSNSVLATIVALGAGTMNVVPWGGPTLRAGSALGVDSTQDLFVPILIPWVAGIITVLIIAFILGKREKARLASELENIKVDVQYDVENNELKRPKLFPVNVLLIVAALVLLIKGTFPPAVVFMMATAAALLINYPKVKDQKERVDAHAKEALMMASLLFAAGSFIGIMSGTGMISSMAESLVNIIPASLGSKLPLLIGILAMPLSLLFDPDSFYFGVLPVIATAAAEFGVSAVDVGRAAILGQMTVGFPVSPLTGATFLLIGLAGVDLGDHQKKTIPWAYLISIIMLAVSLIIGAISL
ncbi:CitMHS family transporter [Lutispora thermophila]|uniref:Citrate-Mg2+:H+ or citrate-Ca2+:H+ symporter, CitMHS family n=1 Tax=Lutispora thermophila DSM 19022 TaxID=1122184 RepID=A0A1M6B325_9FIRM|nr:citrate:proton symporter [Lutispora thermophila]SHI43115.1 citrate-Mg2+:H+ or citrate-Ca2+:H+ symporter, CitMHS family [Lutispora thermophila DSM 19022]